MSLCRADKVLLAGGAAVLGSSALLTATPLAFGASAAFLAVLTDGIFRPPPACFIRPSRMARAIARASR